MPKIGGEFVDTALDLVEFDTRWGHVIVYAEDGTVMREYKISADECKAVAAGNNVAPPNCSLEEWATGRVVVIGKVLNAGQAIAADDGSLFVNFGIDETGGAVRSSISKIAPDKWEFNSGTIAVDSASAQELILNQEQAAMENKP